MSGVEDAYEEHKNIEYDASSKEELNNNNIRYEDNDE